MHNYAKRTFTKFYIFADPREAICITQMINSFASNPQPPKCMESA